VCVYVCVCTCVCVCVCSAIEAERDLVLYTRVLLKSPYLTP